MREERASSRHGNRTLGWARCPLSENKCRSLHVSHSPYSPPIHSPAAVWWTAAQTLTILYSILFCQFPALASSFEVSVPHQLAASF